ncbi:MAG: hypothetical protein IT201_08160 [Thermoleophilia bacterium]|nr:hypothetical protein [Thermoleophilia bacterium]
MTAAARLLGRLEGVRRSGDGWTARCPAHEDRHASLSVGEGADGRALVHCHAGCPAESVVRSVGLALADLFPDEVGCREPRPGGGRGAAAGAARLPSEAEVSTWAARLLDNGKQLDVFLSRRAWTRDALELLGAGVADGRMTLPMRDAEARIVNMGRYAPKPPRGERKMYVVRGAPRVLFPAPESVNEGSGPLFLLEGEPDVLTGTSVGLACVGVPGVECWQDAWAGRFAGRRAVVCFDCDEPGRRGAARVARSLAGFAADVRVLDLDPERDDGFDLSDYVLELLGEDRSGEALAAARDRLLELAGLPEPPRVELTDLGNARMFAHDHTGRLRYVVQRRQWLAWRDGRWRPDDDGTAMRAAKETVERMLTRAVTLDGDERKRAIKHALAAQDEPRLRRMLELAGTEPGLALTAANLDADPWLLACPNGTLDLRTGQLRDHDPADLISVGTDVPYRPDATCERWQRFLLEIFNGDQELAEFTRRAVGYSLTGDTREHVLFVLHGAGCNGKTTFLETVKRLLGGLAATAAFDTFARVRGDRGPRNDLARLHRARLVAAAESGEGRRLDEATVKQITGGDTVAARFLYGEHFEYRPRFKLFLATNHRPRVDGDDDAIWRRIRLVPFAVGFRGREDRELDQALEAELPGILRWAVQGCLAWQRHGLGSAGAVEQATADYRRDEDTLGAFLAERCELGHDHETTPADLRDAYERYCREIGERPPAASVLGKQLSRRGITRAGRSNNYRGVALK